MVACVLSFSAGALTVLSPCVLPLALIAMTSALLLARMPRGGGLRRRPAAPFSVTGWGRAARRHLDSVRGSHAGGAITLAAQRTSVPSAAVVIAAFSVGAGVSLVALAYVSRETLGRRAKSVGRIARPLTGVALVVVGVLTLSGGDRVIETRLVDVMSGWLMDLTTRF